MTNLIGEDSAGIGPDLTQGYDKRFFDCLTFDEGRGLRLTNPGAVVNPAGLRTIGDFLNPTAAVQRARWTESRIRKIMRKNRLALLGTVCD